MPPAGLSNALLLAPRRRRCFKPVTRCIKKCPLCRAQLTRSPITSYTLREVVDAVRDISSDAQAARNRRWSRRADKWRGIFPSENDNKALCDGHANGMEAGENGVVVGGVDPILEHFARAQAYRDISGAQPRREREERRPNLDFHPYASMHRRTRMERAERQLVTQEDPHGFGRRPLGGELLFQEWQVEARAPPQPQPTAGFSQRDEFQIGQAPPSPPSSIHLPPPSVFALPALQQPLPGPSNMSGPQPSPVLPTQPASSSSIQQSSSSSSSAQLLLPTPQSAILESLRALRQQFSTSSTLPEPGLDYEEEDEATDVALFAAMFQNNSHSPQIRDVNNETSLSSSFPTAQVRSSAQSPDWGRQYPIYLEELHLPDPCDSTDVPDPVVDLTDQRRVVNGGVGQNSNDALPFELSSTPRQFGFYPLSAT